MKIFNWLKRRKQEEYIEEETLFEEEVVLEKTLDRDDVDMNDASQRERYVETCLEQMVDALEAVEVLLCKHSVAL